MRPTVSQISIIGLFLSGLCGLPAVQATPVDYSIDFLATFAGNDATGSFTYDASGGLFTNFLVDWEGATFDFTSAANNPTIVSGGPICLGGAIGGAATFEAIGGDCGAEDTPFWFAHTFFGVYDFSFKISDDAAGTSLSVRAFGPSTEDFLAGGGVWVVTPAPSEVPEPTSFLLFGGGMAALFLRRRRKA